MTLWDKTPGLILGLALFTFACEEPGEIGLEINPENGDFVASYFEIPLESKVLQHLDIVSDNTTRIDRSRTRDPFKDVLQGDGRFLVGRTSSPETGAITSTAFAGLYLDKVGFKGVDSDKNPYFFDSLKMFARVEYFNGTNVQSNQKISVYELQDTLLIDSLYLTKSTVDYHDELLGSFDINLLAFDSTQIDTVFSARLSDDLGQRFMDQVQTDTLPFSSNSEFRKFFNGFALVPGETNDVMLGIHAESNSTFIRMYFHSIKDTTFLDFVFDEAYTSDGDLLNKYFNHITLDKTGTATDIINEYYKEFETTDEYSYIMGSTGIFTKVDFSPFYNLMDTVEFLVINRAELTVPVKSYLQTLPPSGSLDLYLTDDSNRFMVSTDSLTSKLSYLTVGGLTLVDNDDGSNASYIGNITSYVQGLADGTTDSEMILLGQSGLWNSVSSVNQSIIEKDKILLRVYYSSLK